MIKVNHKKGQCPELPGWVEEEKTLQSIFGWSLFLDVTLFKYINKESLQELTFKFFFLFDTNGLLLIANLKIYKRLIQKENR